MLLEVQGGHSHYSLLKESYYKLSNGGGTRWFTNEHFRSITSDEELGCDDVERRDTTQANINDFFSRSYKSDATILTANTLPGPSTNDTTRDNIRILLETKYPPSKLNVVQKEKVRKVNQHARQEFCDALFGKVRKDSETDRNEPSEGAEPPQRTGGGTERAQPSPDDGLFCCFLNMLIYSYI